MSNKCYCVKSTIFPSDTQLSRDMKRHKMELLKYLKFVLKYSNCLSEYIQLHSTTGCMFPICLCHRSEQKVHYTIQAPPVSMQCLFSAVSDYSRTITWLGSGVVLPKQVSLHPDRAVAEATSSAIILYIASLLHWGSGRNRLWARCQKHTAKWSIAKHCSQSPLYCKGMWHKLLFSVGWSLNFQDW